MDTIDQGAGTPVPARPVRNRRHYTKSLKRQMVEETLAGRDSVSVVARRYDVNDNQLFKWRQQYRQGLLAEEPDPQPLIPVAVTPSPASMPVLDDAENTAQSPGRLEITLSGGHRLVITGTVCLQSLQTVLRVLSAC